MCIHNFGAGTALRSVPANHVVLVRLTLDQFIFWPKLPQIAGFGIKNLKKKFSGVTPPDPLSRSGRSPPALTSSTTTRRARGRKFPRAGT